VIVYITELNKGTIKYKNETIRKCKMNNDECTKTYTQIHMESKMEIVLNQFQELSKINRFDITLKTRD